MVSERESSINKSGKRNKKRLAIVVLVLFVILSVSYIIFMRNISYPIGSTSYTTKSELPGISMEEFKMANKVYISYIYDGSAKVAYVTVSSPSTSIYEENKYSFNVEVAIFPTEDLSIESYGIEFSGVNHPIEVELDHMVGQVASALSISESAMYNGMGKIFIINNWFAIKSGSVIFGFSVDQMEEKEGIVFKVAFSMKKNGQSGSVAKSVKIPLPTSTIISTTSPSTIPQGEEIGSGIRIIDFIQVSNGYELLLYDGQAKIATVTLSFPLWFDEQIIQETVYIKTTPTISVNFDTIYWAFEGKNSPIDTSTIVTSIYPDILKSLISKYTTENGLGKKYQITDIRAYTPNSVNIISSHALSVGQERSCKVEIGFVLYKDEKKLTAVKSIEINIPSQTVSTKTTTSWSPTTTTTFPTTRTTSTTTTSTTTVPTYTTTPLNNTVLKTTRALPDINNIINGYLCGPNGTEGGYTPQTIPGIRLGEGTRIRIQLSASYNVNFYVANESTFKSGAYGKPIGQSGDLIEIGTTSYNEMVTIPTTDNWYFIVYNPSTGKLINVTLLVSMEP